VNDEIKTSDHSEVQTADMMRRIRNQRRAIREYGEAGTEPILFPVMECRLCSDPLYSCSRSPVPGICRSCLRDQVNKAKADKEASKAGWSAMWIVPAIVVMMAVAWVLGQAAGKMFFWLGAVLP